MIEQRKAQRFDLKLPFELTRNGSRRTSQFGETKNISSIGALIQSEAQVQAGEMIEYLITLPTLPQSKRVRLRCLGKVVRRYESEIAVTLERYEFVRNGSQD